MIIEDTKILKDKLEEEKQQVESLRAKHAALTTKLEDMVAREMQLNDETSHLEKSLAMLKHDLKEVSSVTYDMIVRHSVSRKCFLHTSYHNPASAN